MFHSVYSPLMHAWLVLFGDDLDTASVLRIFNTKAEADSYLQEISA